MFQVGNPSSFCYLDFFPLRHKETPATDDLLKVKDVGQNWEPGLWRVKNNVSGTSKRHRKGKKDRKNCSVTQYNKVNTTIEHNGSIVSLLGIFFSNDMYFLFPGPAVI